jgi:hypothetical protein
MPLTILLLLLVLLLLSFTGFTSPRLLPAGSQEVSERGILVQGDERVLVDGAYLILTGNVTVKDNGTLILKGSSSR